MSEANRSVLHLIPRQDATQHSKRKNKWPKNTQRAIKRRFSRAGPGSRIPASGLRLGPRNDRWCGTERERGERTEDKWEWAAGPSAKISAHVHIGVNRYLAISKLV